MTTYASCIGFLVNGQLAWVATMCAVCVCVCVCVSVHACVHSCGCMDMPVMVRGSLCFVPYSPGEVNSVVGNKGAMWSCPPTLAGVVWCHGQYQLIV